MPKIIKNLEETITNSALDLFRNLDYDEVDMKKIAKNSGIAVGTLYNYFPNKLELYITVLCQSWNDTLDKINNIPHYENDPKLQIKEFISVLYDDVSFRNGMGSYGLSSNKAICTDERIIDLKNSIQTTLMYYFESTKTKITKEEIRKFFECLLVNLSLLIHNYYEERSSNIQLLSDMFISYLKFKNS